MRLNHCLLRSLASVAVFTTVSAVSWGGDWYVDASQTDCGNADGSEANPLCTINDALAAAAHGDTIYVAPGTYVETLILNKDVSLVATRIGWDDQLFTVIDGGGDGAVMQILSSTVSLHGFLITGGTGVDNCCVNMLDSTVSLSRCLVKGNEATGLCAVDSVLDVYQCSFVDNGRGMEIDVDSEVTLDSSTLARNAPIGPGGGLDNAGVCTLVNCTVSNNSGSFGAGIRNTGTLSVLHCTVVENFASDGGGGLWSEAGTAEMGHSMLAQNSGPGSPDCLGQLTSLGYNLIKDRTGCDIIGDESGNIYGVNPRIGDLRYGGGPTEAHSIGPQSRALNVGSPVDRCPEVDQRGVTRRICDIGAFERDLGLRVDTPVANVGDLVKIHTRQGLPEEVVMLGVIWENTFLIFIGTTNHNGRFVQELEIPGPMSGMDVLLHSISTDTFGYLIETNYEELYVQ